MERLVYSKPLPCRYSSPFLSRRDFSQILSSPPPATTTFPRRFTSLSCTPTGSRSLPQRSHGGSIAESNPELRSMNRVWISNNIPELIKKVIHGGFLTIILPLVLTFLHTPPSLALSGATATAAVTVGRRFMRSELLSGAWTGFLAGCLHTLSGPDHLAALAPLSIGRTKVESAAVGALWGCGHDAGQVLFGLIFLLLKDKLHIEVIRTWGSIIVGFTLLIIGVIGIKEAAEASAPAVSLASTEFSTTTIGTHEQALLIEAPVKKKIGFATFATGIVHGLQPDALMMILPALALPSRLAGAAFLVMFLVGTVFAMGSYTAFIGSCSQALKDRIPRITEKLTWASSLVAIALGVAIMISQFVGFSLY